MENNIIGPIDLDYWSTLRQLRVSIASMKEEDKTPKRLGREEETYKLLLKGFRN